MVYTAREYARIRIGALAVSLVAWLLLLAPSASSPAGPGPARVLSYCAARPYAPGGAAAVPGEAAIMPLLTTAQAQSLLGGWALMLVAMMTPLLVQPICHIHAGSFARRRARATALFVAGYGAGWLAAGVLLLLLEQAARLGAPQSYLPAGLVGLALLIWQASPAKQRYLNRCHRHRPLAAFGWAADKDALLMGLEHSRWCIGSCWAAMLLPLLLPHGHVAAMLAVSVLMLCERLDPPRTPAWRWRGFGTAWRYARLRLLGPQHSPAPAVLAAHP